MATFKNTFNKSHYVFNKHCKMNGHLVFIEQLEFVSDVDSQLSCFCCSSTCSSRADLLLVSRARYFFFFGVYIHGVVLGAGLVRQKRG